MRDVIKEVLDEYARSNFYSDSFRNHVAGEIEKRLGSVTQNGYKVKRKYNSVETNEKVDTVKETVTRRQDPVMSDELKKLNTEMVVGKKSVTHIPTKSKSAKNLKSLTTKSRRKSKSNKSNTKRK